MDQPQREMREGVRGFRCPTCDRAFYVSGNEEAYACPICTSESIWEMVGPFAVVSGKALSDPPAVEPGGYQALQGVLAGPESDAEFDQAVSELREPAAVPVQEQK